MKMILNKRWGHKLLLLFSICFLAMTSLNIFNKEMKAEVIELDIPKVIDYKGGNASSYLYLLKDNGRVYSAMGNDWYINVSGALGNGNFGDKTYALDHVLTADKKPLENIIKIGLSAQSYESGGSSAQPNIIGAFLAKDGTFYTVGNTDGGAVRAYITEGGKFATAIPFANIKDELGILASDVKEFHMTNKNLFILTNDGKLYGSGTNDLAQLTLDGQVDAEYHKLKELTIKDENGQIMPIDSVSITTHVFGVLSSGKVYVWGKNTNSFFGTTDTSGTVYQPSPVIFENGLILSDVDRFDIIPLSANKEGEQARFYAHHKDTNELYVWGNSSRMPVSTNTDLVRNPMNFQVNNSGENLIIPVNDYWPGYDSLYFRKDGEIYGSSTKKGKYASPMKDYVRVFNPSDASFDDSVIDDAEFIVSANDANSECGYVYTSSGDLYRYNYDQSSLNKLYTGKFSINAVKEDNTSYIEKQKHNGKVKFNIKFTVAGYDEVNYNVIELANNTATESGTAKKDELSVQATSDRTYVRYDFHVDEGEVKSVILDLYKDTPKLGNYSTTSENLITINHSIDLSVPQDQKDWNSYTATITKPDGSTVDYTEEPLTEQGSYTLHVKDEYGNTIDYTFETTPHAIPTIEFTPNPTGELVYGNDITKANQNIGAITLVYGENDTPSTIQTITLDSSLGDGALFTLAQDGTLTVNGNDLNAKDSYELQISGTDANGMNFSGIINIKIDKADQPDYKIVTGTKKEEVYNFIYKQSQEIELHTIGALSTGAEILTITQGDGTIATLTGSTPEKFKMLSPGKFSVQAELTGDINYKDKTITQEIEISDLPPQTGFHITSGTSMNYGDTYQPEAEGGQSTGNVTWSISNDSGTGATIDASGKITVTGVGTFELTATKAGDSNYQSVSDHMTVTVVPMKVLVQAKDVTIKTGQSFQDQGVTYKPQPLSQDHIGTPILSTTYQTGDAAGCYDINVDVTSIANANYTFTAVKGTLTVENMTLPDQGRAYYEVIGTKGKNGWYTSDIQIKTTGKDGYTKISQTNTNFTGDSITVSKEGEYDISLYFKHTDGTITKPITYKVKIDKTAPSIPTMTVDEINTGRIARLLNMLSFGSWMNKEAQVTMNSSDAISGLDIYEYVETIKGTDSQPKTSSGTVTYGDETELTLKARACDKAGNCSVYTNSEEVKIDLKVPEITGVKDQNEYKQYYIPRFITVSDAGSGLDQANYTKDSSIPISIDKETKVKGEGTYTVYAIDRAGNEVTIIFKIVNLPEIETEIDGSDESKDVIDQVEKELEENKDKLTPDEVKDYEKWIEDATDKWESLRKKVVETDDKNAKVEGVGDTSFDPSVELIVDPITENDVPTLPRKAISIYDVYLKKGDQEILPNGEIKVYLPYTESETPIIYEIDDDGAITEITGTIENGFATFHTTVLKKYAISNTKQDENKDPDDNKDNQNPTPNPDDGKDPDNNKPDPNPDNNTIDIDSDGDGKPDVNIDFDCDGKADINMDINNDGIPDINIDTSGDGKPNYNVDLDGDQIPDLNIGPVKWKTDRCTTNGCGKEYCTSTYYKPYLNIDTDGDLRPDVNVDLNKDKIADINIDLDGDNIPDIEIDTNGDGQADINLDTTGDGRADTNLAIIKEWIPDKDVNEPIKYDTMSNIKVDQSLTPDTWQTSKEYQSAKGTPTPPKQTVKETNNTNQGGVNTGDSTKAIYLWIIVIVSAILTIVTSKLKSKVK